MPVGITVGVGVVASYLFALDALRLSLSDSRTVATTVLVLLGLYVILVLEAAGHRRATIVAVAAAALAAVYALALLMPWTRDFFALSAPAPAILATAAGGTALGVLGLVLSGFVPGAASTPARPRPE